MFKNPFKEQVQRDMEAQMKQQADYEMAYGALTSSQEAAMDEQALLERRETLLQLSQWQQDRTPVMQKLFLKLCGYKYDKEEKKIYKVEWDKGYVNVLGAQKLINFIEPLDRNVMLANWNDQILIRTIREGIAHPLRRFLFFNHAELGLKIEHAEYIFNLIINTVEPTYWRGWNDGERRKDREIIKVQELRNPYFQQKKKGVFGLEA